MAYQPAAESHNIPLTSEKDIHSTAAVDTTNVKRYAAEIDHVAERKLVRKLDLWIVPPGTYHKIL